MRDVNPAEIEEFVIGSRRYRADGGGLWVVPDGGQAVEPEEFLLAFCQHLLVRTHKLSAANRSLKALIRRFVRRQATWAELKQAAELCPEPKP